MVGTLFYASNSAIGAKGYISGRFNYWCYNESTNAIVIYAFLEFSLNNKINKNPLPYLKILSYNYLIIIFLYYVFICTRQWYRIVSSNGTLQPVDEFWARSCTAIYQRQWWVASFQTITVLNSRSWSQYTEIWSFICCAR